jgi:anti-sigma regulatory factor (Ser/Thr protein kinase)
MPEMLVVQAEMVELARVSDWVDGLVERWGLPQSTSFAIHLCCEEAISNVILHGFSDEQVGAEFNKDVRLVLEHRNDAVGLTIEDHGFAFDPLAAAAPVAPTTVGEATIGGLGIQLMRKFAKHLSYERRDGMNCLTLCFDLAKAAD